MAGATTAIEGRMRPQRKRRTPDKLRDYVVESKTETETKTKTKTEEIRLVYHRRSFKEKPVVFCPKISSCSSDGVSRELIPMDHPNSYVCLESERTKRYRSRSRRLSKATSIASILPKRLTDFLFDNYFQIMWRESPKERREMCAYLTAVYFRSYTLEHYRGRVLNWVKKWNIFSKKYVFVPILLWSHWNLLIFCHLGERLDSRTPCMLLLDSLQAYSSISELEPLIRRFVLDIFETEGRPESKDMIEKIPLLVPEVPQQENFTDCGIYVLYYIYLFLEGAPEHFSDGYPYFMTKKWFTMKQLKGFYGKLDEALVLSSSEEENEEGEEEEKGVSAISEDEYRRVLMQRKEEEKVGVSEIFEDEFSRDVIMQRKEEEKGVSEILEL